MRENKYTVSSDELKNQAHVWFCSPDEITDNERLAYYQSLLSDDETIQHKRFQFPSDRHTYLVSHALVRTVLSKYTDVKPEDWAFKKNSHGRPEINQQFNGKQLKFNLTHTKGLCACVVTLNVECGIDAEIITRKNNLPKIAEKMFAQSEIDSMHELKKSEYQKAFFNYWTLRESYVKALGTGLGGSSKDFNFIIENPDATINFSSNYEYISAEKELWQFALFAPDENYVSAVALKNESNQRLKIIDNNIVP